MRQGIAMAGAQEEVARVGGKGKRRCRQAEVLEVHWRHACLPWLFEFKNGHSKGVEVAGAWGAQARLRPCVGIFGVDYSRFRSNTVEKWQ
jgi:hypothetical protein